MFTGIIKEIAEVYSIEKTEEIIRIGIKAEDSLKDAEVDDSIAINGVCLTIVDLMDGVAFFDILPETIRRTSLGKLQLQNKVNIESSLSLASKIGGHMIQGHVDDTVIVKDIIADGEAKAIVFEGKQDYIKMIVEKAFISLDGISLTVTEVKDNTFKVMVIPHTFNNTIIKYWEKGTIVNIEVDIINKSIYRYMELLNSKEK